MQKVLLMGPHNGGKTSMRSVIFANFLARDTGRLGATVEMMRSQIKVLGSFVLNMWDCGGQTAYIRGYLDKQRQQTFSHVAALIYVCDAPVLSRAAEEGTQAEALADFNETLQALREHSPRARVFVLVHKVDLLRNRDETVGLLIDSIKSTLFTDRDDNKLNAGSYSNENVAATDANAAEADAAAESPGSTKPPGTEEELGVSGDSGGRGPIGGASSATQPNEDGADDQGAANQSNRSDGGDLVMERTSTAEETPPASTAAASPATASAMSAKPPEPEFFCTTIWDDSLFKAWGAIMRCLIPNLNLLEAYLASSLDSMGLTEATVLDTSTLLTVCTVVAEGREPHEASRVTSALKAFKLSCTKSHRAFTDFVMVSGRATIVFDRLTANTMAMLVAHDASPEVMRLHAVALRQGLSPFLEMQGADGAALRSVL